MKPVSITHVLRSRLFWVLAVCMLLMGGLSWGFVWMKTKDCQLLCGESAREQAAYRVGAGVVRNGSSPMRGGCDCGQGKLIPAQ
ncbi:MAG: hypothetical protein ACT6Q9_11895 [Polaromonas sp.]|uniref:hypothetical protein n=1 Tax=Polaromonas sp. TaxID=1869339 RepID=UPI004036FFF1